MENNRHTKIRIGSYWHGVGFFDVLLIVFIVLKLCHLINWSWWWVLSPLWASIIFVIVLIIIVAIARLKD